MSFVAKPREEKKKGSSGGNPALAQRLQTADRGALHITARERAEPWQVDQQALQAHEMPNLGSELGKFLITSYGSHTPRCSRAKGQCNATHLGVDERRRVRSS